MISTTSIRSLIIITGACLLAIIAGGCATSNYGTTVGLEKPLNTYLAAYFSADSEVAEDIGEQLFKFEESTSDKLSEAKLFQVVNIGQWEGKCEKSLDIKATVTRIRKVTGTSRFFFGIFAGDAVVEATVTVSDGMTKQTHGTYTVKGTSGNNGFIGTTNTAINNAAKAIVKIIKENHT